MLMLKPNCECCLAELSPSAAGAYICSFECTWCEACATGRLGGTCPNCGGGLAPRPARSAALLVRFPASADRARQAAACTG